MAVEGRRARARVRGFAVQAALGAARARRRRNRSNALGRVQGAFRFARGGRR